MATILYIYVYASLVVSDSAPEISDVFGSTTATITEAVANPLVGFDDISIEASINDGMHDKTDEALVVFLHCLYIAVSMNNVQLTVNRFGQVGIISVLWQAGTNQLAGVENGSIIPATGSIEMQPTDLTETIILTVSLAFCYLHFKNCDWICKNCIVHRHIQFFEFKDSVRDDRET